MKRLKTLRELDVNGKTVLLRSDLNSDIIKGKVLKGQRIKESLKSILFLKKQGARVVILAHQGNLGKKDFLSLKQHAKLMGRKIKFIEDIIGEKAIDSIKGMKNGDVILLDNVRFVKDEFEPRKKGNLLKKKLLPLIDVYVNDAFSVSHRNHFSLVGFEKVKEKGIGFLFEKEIRALESVSMKNCLYILGGAKPESDIKLLDRGNKVITCGLFGQTCLRAQGFDFGYQNKFLEKADLINGGYGKFLSKLKKKMRGVEMPVDFAVNFNGKRKEFRLDDFPLNYRIEDIGKKSIEKFRKIISKHKNVYVKGPAGWAEDKRFRRGTVEILKAVSKCQGFSLVGGGQLSEVISKTRSLSEKRFGYVSLSGGATLAFIAEDKLPGLKALGYY